jgi:accessory gene regulator protein AgrB
VETLTRERRPVRATGLRSAFTGADGNARLTATTGLVLLVLLPIEGLTLFSLHSFLSVHMLVGVALIPPIALKLGSTFYRFFRYYTGSAIFREKGPPQLVMRILVAPALVASTIGLFGSGVALMLLEHPNSLVFAIHKGSFIIWLGAIAIHVLAYLQHLPGLAVADWVRGKQEAVGRRLRRRAVVASLLTGGGVAMIALPLVAAWHR